MSLNAFMLRRMPGPPRVKRERERKPVRSTLEVHTGSRAEMTRRYLSGQLIRALTAVERYWRAGFDNPTLLAEGGNSQSAKLFGPGRAPPEEDPDFYTLRYKARGTIIGAEGGMFVLKPQTIVLRDSDYALGLAQLRADGLCCEQCAENGVIYEKHRGYLGFDDEESTTGRCVLNDLLRRPRDLDLWVTHADAVVRAEGVAEEFIKIALVLFDRATYYETEPKPIQEINRGRPKKGGGSE